MSSQDYARILDPSKPMSILYELFWSAYFGSMIFDMQRFVLRILSIDKE